MPFVTIHFMILCEKKINLRLKNLSEYELMYRVSQFRSMKEMKVTIMPRKHPPKINSSTKRYMDCIVFIDSYTAKSESANFTGEGGSVIFCVIPLILIMEMTLLISIVLWRFFDIDLLKGNYGRSNLDVFNITNHNDYSHHHYRIDS